MGGACSTYSREDVKGRDHLQDVGISTIIYYNGSWRNRVGRCGLDLPSLGQGPVAALVNTVMDCYFLKKDSAP
jgi:hypothetical protein